MVIIVKVKILEVVVVFCPGVDVVYTVLIVIEMVSDCGGID